MELIIIKRNGKLEYYHKFQVDVDTRHIVIKRSKNENDNLYITVKRNFVHPIAFQRILCIDECESDRKKYLLIFANVEDCIKFIVSVKISKAKNTLVITVSNDEEKFHSKYFAPIINECLENTLMDKELEPLISEFLEYYNANDEQEDDILQLEDEAATSNKSVNPIIATQNTTTEKSERICQANERSHSVNANIYYQSKGIFVNEAPIEKAIDQDDEETASDVSYSINDNDSNMNVGITVAETLNVSNPNDDDNNMPRRSLRARNNNISYYVDNVPVTRPLKRKYPTKASQQREPEPKKQKLLALDEKIYAPNFKYFHYLRMGNTRSTLIILPSSDRTKCYEYYYDFKRKKYICRGCGGVNKQCTPARIEQDENGVDYYVICEKTKHICKLRQYEPEKYKSDYIIEKPNYDIVKENVINIDGIEELRDFLLLYTSADKKNYFKFSWDNHQKLFYCLKCWNVKRYIQAFVHKDVVYVRNVKHVCSTKKYLKVIKTSLMPETENYQPPVRQWIKRYKPPKKTSSTKKLQMRRQNKNVFIQPTIPELFRTPPKLGCEQQSQSEHPPIPSTPRISVEARIIRKPNYQIFQREYQGRMLRKLAIFDSTDAAMCYEYSWSNHPKYYLCHPCHNRFTNHVFAKVIKTDDEEEYVEMSENGHKCQLKKFVL